MKGIILAAGSGTRLSPATLPISKILLPIYDRPMVYYPLATLMEASVKEILIITNEKDSDNFKRTLGDGSQFGIKIDYEIQYVQRGISDAFIIAEKWIAGEEVVLILGDNIIYGDNLETTVSKAIKTNVGATIFGYRVPNPEKFGVVEFDNNMKILSIEEKPVVPKSNCIAVGLYIYNSTVCDKAKLLKPSKRGELEITDLNIEYLKNNDLSITILDENVRWMDAGSFNTILGSSSLVYNEEKRIGRKIMCPEIIAYRKGYISKDKLIQWISQNSDSDYFKSVKEELGFR